MVLMALRSGWKVLAGVENGVGGGVQVCRLWVALMVVLGDFGGWVKIRLMGEDVGQILALLKVNNRG